MTLLASRRSFITGLVSLIAAPAIIRAGSLMPVKVMEFGPFDPDCYRAELVVDETALMRELRDVTRRAMVPRMFVDIQFGQPQFRQLATGKYFSVDT